MTSGAADDGSVQREVHATVSVQRASVRRFEPLNSRLVRNGVLLVLVALMLARVPYSATTMDLARDMFIGLRVLHGDAFPLTGPIFGGVFHLGPVWNYLLALLLALCGGSWQGVIATLGLLIAAQIPLAYLAGKALDGRLTGVLGLFVEPAIVGHLPVPAAFASKPGRPARAVLRTVRNPPVATAAFTLPAGHGLNIHSCAACTSFQHCADLAGCSSPRSNVA